jgi:hypothetical protein
VPAPPFACELETAPGLLSGADVLASLNARDFRSKYIANLDVTQIPAPGYHPATVTALKRRDLATILPHNMFLRLGTKTATRR